MNNRPTSNPYFEHRYCHISYLLEDCVVVPTWHILLCVHEGQHCIQHSLPTEINAHHGHQCNGATITRASHLLP